MIGIQVYFCWSGLVSGLKLLFGLKDDANSFWPGTSLLRTLKIMEELESIHYSNLTGLVSNRRSIGRRSLI
jgi:hypothetical protein